MEFSLDKDIFTNNFNYFFTIHGPRFEYMNEMMAKSLESRYGHKFKPIRIYNAWPSDHYNKENHIILNKKAYRLKKQLNQDIIFLPDYEDVNVEFCKNSEIKKITQKLLKKQKTVFVFPFTTSFLDLPTNQYTVLGPNPHIAKIYDNKVHQYQLFKDLELPCNNAQIIHSKEELLNRARDLLPCYLTAAYTSGGNESDLIYDPTMLKEFLSRIRKINKKHGFVSSKIFKNILNAPNVNAIISKNEVYILSISDQLLHGNKYLGNFYPSECTSEQLYKIKTMVRKIGKHLYQNGYTGLFGCDFLVNKSGEIVIIDLNPRHQGGYTTNGIMLEQKGLSLTDLELDAFGNKELLISQEQLDEKLNFAWGHSKLAPVAKGDEIQNEYVLNDEAYPFNNIGTSFISEFYKPGSLFIDGYSGYTIVSGQTTTEVKLSLVKAKEEFERNVFY